MKKGETNPAVIIIVVVMVMMLISPLTMLFKMSGFKLTGTHILIIGAAGILIWIVCMYNSLVNSRERVKQASSGIDVYLKQRFDLIPNLVETVKGYAKYEKELLESITKLRSDYLNRNENSIKESQELNERYSNILALVEGYPELKASESFLNLQKALTKIESQLQAARRIYNMEVTEYNTKRMKVPSNIIAGLFGFKEADLFEISESTRENININI